MINDQDIPSAYRTIGQTACWMVFVLGVFYAVITTIGLFSLESPQHSIGNPYFTIMEILSILIALLMAVSLVAMHYSAAPDDKFYSLTALILMFITTAITSCVHFLILSLSYTTEVVQESNFLFFFSFRWPSVVYVLDILAWDFFFGLSMLFLVPVFKKTRLEKNLKTVLLVSGILSLIGLIGVPLQNMQIRNIGIIGYAVAGPIAFLLMGKILGRSTPAQH